MTEESRPPKYEDQLREARARAKAWRAESAKDLTEPQKGLYGKYRLTMASEPQSLVERLDRWASSGWTEGETGDVSRDLREAADRIEEYEAIIADLWDMLPATPLRPEFKARLDALIAKMPVTASEIQSVKENET